MRHLSFFTGRGGGNSNKFSKNLNAWEVARGGYPGGMLKLQFHWYIIFKVGNSDEAVGNTNCC